MRWFRARQMVGGHLPGNMRMVLMLLNVELTEKAQQQSADVHSQVPLLVLNKRSLQEIVCHH